MFQFVRFPSHTLWYGWLCITTAGLLHSDICGSKIICISPQLFAACHVLLRQISPRHPPYALSILTYVFTLTFLAFWVSFSTSEKSFLDELFFLSFLLLYSFQRTGTWLFVRLVEMRRIELLTPCLQGRCSPSWATPPWCLCYFFLFFLLFAVRSGGPN